MQSETDDSMQTDTDNISLEICQMMQAKDEQIRRLVLGMERCVRTRSHRTPHVNTLSCFCVLLHSMQLQQTSQKLEHAKAIDDLQDALLASVAGPPAASELRLVPASVLASRLAVLEAAASAHRAELLKRPSHCYTAPPRQATSIGHAMGPTTMALSKLSEDQHRSIFGHLCNTFEPRVALDFSSASSGLWAATQAMRQQLRVDHEVAAALCLKVGMRSCKELREAKEVFRNNKGLSAADLTTLGTMGAVLPALVRLYLSERSASPDSVQRLAEGLGVGALPAMTCLWLCNMPVGNAGASSLAAALGRGALPRLGNLWLTNAALGDAGLVALAPALRRRPALVVLRLTGNPLGDEGLTALLAPLPLPAGGLKKLKQLWLDYTQVSDAGCAVLASALDRGALRALDFLTLKDIPASAAEKEAVQEVLRRRVTLSALAKEAVHAAMERSRATSLGAARLTQLEDELSHDQWDHQGASRCGPS